MPMLLFVRFRSYGWRHDFMHILTLMCSLTPGWKAMFHFPFGANPASLIGVTTPDSDVMVQWHTLENISTSLQQDENPMGDFTRMLSYSFTKPNRSPAISLEGFIMLTTWWTTRKTSGIAGLCLSELPPKIYEINEALGLMVNIWVLGD